MKPVSSKGRKENQRETSLLVDVIRTTRFCEPINSLIFLANWMLAFYLQHRVPQDSDGQSEEMSYTMSGKPVNRECQPEWRSWIR